MTTRSNRERARSRILVRNALAGRQQVAAWARMGLGTTPEEVTAGAQLRSRIGVAVRRGDWGAAQAARNDLRRYQAALAARRITEPQERTDSGANT